MAIILGWVLSVIIAAAGGMYVGGYWNEAGHSLETIKEQKEEIRIDREQDNISHISDEKAVKVETQIVTVFKDRWRTITKEVPVEIVAKMDAECVVPNRFVELWNSANKEELPDPTRAADGSPSGITLSDISEQKELESQICIANTKRLIGLQEWVAHQEEVFNK